MKKIINTKNAPAAIGPYVQAIKVGDMLYVSGQIPMKPNGEMVEEDVSKQSIQVLENLKAILKEANASINNVVKITCYITDMSNFPIFNEIYSRYFSNNFPARACVEVSKLPRNSMVEIDAIVLCS